jgi:hypothetical protein
VSLTIYRKTRKRYIVNNLPYESFIRIKDTLMRRDYFTKVEKKGEACVFTNCGNVVAEIACTLEDVEKALNPVRAA